MTTALACLCQKNEQEELLCTASGMQRAQDHPFTPQWLRYYQQPLTHTDPDQQMIPDITVVVLISVKVWCFWLQWLKTVSKKNHDVTSQAGYSWTHLHADSFTFFRLLKCLWNVHRHKNAGSYSRIWSPWNVYVFAPAQQLAFNSEHIPHIVKSAGGCRVCVCECVCGCVVKPGIVCLTVQTQIFWETWGRWWIMSVGKAPVLTCRTNLDIKKLQIFV